MAKKTSMAARHAAPKKSQKRPRQLLRSPQQFTPRYFAGDEEDAPRPAATSSLPVGRSRMRSTVQLLSTDYHYVASDLKRIAITAGALLAIMIILVFVVK